MTLHPAIREALAVHEALRRLHFTADEIFLKLSGRNLYVLARRGDREFHTLVGEGFDATQDVLGAHWEHACNAWNVTMSEAERQAIYAGSEVCRQSVGFVAAVIAKGFSIAPVQA